MTASQKHTKSDSQVPNLAPQARSKLMEFLKVRETVLGSQLGYLSVRCRRSVFEMGKEMAIWCERGLGP
jgi:hypothetical protein